jgi:hypothetical protein
MKTLLSIIVLSIYGLKINAQQNIVKISNEGSTDFLKISYTDDTLSAPAATIAKKKVFGIGAGIYPIGFFTKYKSQGGYVNIFFNAKRAIQISYENVVSGNGFIQLLRREKRLKDLGVNSYDNKAVDYSGQTFSAGLIVFGSQITDTKEASYTNNYDKVINNPGSYVQTIEHYQAKKSMGFITGKRTPYYGLKFIYRLRNVDPFVATVSDVVNVTPATTRYDVQFKDIVDKQYVLALTAGVRMYVLDIATNFGLGLEQFSTSNKEFNNKNYKIESITLNTAASSFYPYFSIRVAIGTDFIVNK